MALYWRFDPLGTAGGTLTPIAGSRGVFLSSGTTLVSSAMQISGGTVGSGYAADKMYVYSGGVATDTSVLGGGVMHIRSGGVGSGIVGGGNGIYVSTYGRAEYISANKYVYCYGGTVTHARFPSGVLITSRRPEEDSPCSAEDVTFGNWTTLSIKSGTSVISCVLSGTSAKGTVSSGALISSAVVSTGLLTVLGGGSAHIATIRSGGSLTVSSGGVATDVTSMTGAVVTVIDGGTITYK